MLEEGLFGQMELAAPAKREAVAELEARLDVKLPDDYKDFLMQSSGAEGPIGTESYLVLWPLDDIVDHNLGYKVAESAPNLLLFGSNGGGTAYAFERLGSDIEVVSAELVDISEVTGRWRSFHEFLTDLAQG